jgi:hypothetical protein
LLWLLAAKKRKLLHLHQWLLQHQLQLTLPQLQLLQLLTLTLLPLLRALLPLLRTLLLLLRALLPPLRPLLPLQRSNQLVFKKTGLGRFFFVWTCLFYVSACISCNGRLA